MSTKYPWIPKEYYPAVMGACSYIRSTGWFNKAISYYAKKYNVDKDSLENYVRERQGAGQKIKGSSRRNYKYYWFKYVALDDWDNPYFGTGIYKATNRKNAINQISDGFVQIDEEVVFDTEAEAEEYATEWTAKNANNR